MPGIHLFLIKLVRRVILDWWRLEVAAPLSTSPQLSRVSFVQWHCSKRFETLTVGSTHTPEITPCFDRGQVGLRLTLG